MNITRSRRLHAAPARLLAAVLLAWGTADAATVLEYAHDGDCATEFERMAIDGLRARVDMRMEGMPMSTLFDDGEQIMRQLMHETRTYMTVESDDDAIDFTSDVGRSVSLYAEKQTKAVTGMDNAQAMAVFRDMQVAACPEMAGIGFSDPDYADAAQLCAEKMASAPAAAGVDRRQAIAQRLRQREGRPAASAAKGAGAAVKWSTTTVRRADASETVDAHACMRERIMRGDVVLREDCMAAVDSLGLDPRAQRRLKRIAAVGKGMSAGVASLYPQAEMDRVGPPAISIERICHRDGAVSGHARLRIRTDTAIDASIFELPPGYAPMQMARPSDTAPTQQLDLLQPSGSLQR